MITDEHNSLLSLARQLEESVWNAVVARDGEALARLFSDDYVEITLDEKRHARDAIVEESPQVDNIRNWNINELRVMKLADQSLLPSYQLDIEGTCRGNEILPQRRWATSIWTCVDNVWRFERVLAGGRALPLTSRSHKSVANPNSNSTHESADSRFIPTKPIHRPARHAASVAHAGNAFRRLAE